MENTPPTNPYAAPVSHPTAPPPTLPGAPAGGPYGHFRDNRTLAKIVIILLLISFVAEFITYGSLASNIVAVFLVSGITKLQDARRPTTTAES